MGRTTSHDLRAYAVLLLMPLLMSSNLVLGRAAVETVEPWTLAFWRWLIAFAVLLPFTWRGLAEQAPRLRQAAGTILLLGILGMGVCGAGCYMALRGTTATNATLIYTSSPVFILLLEIAFRGQRTSPRQVIGIAMAFLGVAAIILHGDLARLLAFDFQAGDLGMAAVAGAWAIYSVVLKRAGLGEVPTLVLFAAIAAAGVLVLLPGMLWELVHLDAFPTGTDAWISIWAIALVSSVLAFWTYLYGVKAVGATVTGIFMYLLPAYGVLLAILFLGEELRAYHGAGFVLVTLGVALATAPAALWRRMAG